VVACPGPPNMPAKPRDRRDENGWGEERNRVRWGDLAKQGCAVVIHEADHEEKKEAEKVRAESTCGFKKGLLLCSHHLHIVALFLKE